MKAILLTTVKYGSGKYLYVGESYDLDGPLPADVKKVLTSIKDDHTLVRLVGMPPEPSVTEPAPSDEVEPSTTEPSHTEDTVQLSRRG